MPSEKKVIFFPFRKHILYKYQLLYNFFHLFRESESRYFFCYLSRNVIDVYQNLKKQFVKKISRDENSSRKHCRGTMDYSVMFKETLKL